MARLILTHDGAVIREYRLEKERTTVGRKPHNDIVLEGDSTVSGEHAVFLKLQHIYVEDLGSTNGVLLNGRKVSKRQLNHGDSIKIGRHELKFIDDSAKQFERTVIISPDAVPKATGAASTVANPASAAAAAKRATIKILNGVKTGEQIVLSKAYTTVGTPGTQVAVIARRGAQYHLMQMRGVGSSSLPPLLNNQPVGAESTPLKHGDIIEVASMKLQFVEAQ
jgi:pSer/pThr/pTyr-binding forkhead associated (FHA) protein